MTIYCISLKFDFSIRFRLTVRDPSNREYFSLRSLHSFCVPGEYAESIYVPTENARKVFKRLRRMRGKYLSVDGDYIKSGLSAV
jgi:hypothetical protein